MENKNNQKTNNKNLGAKKAPNKIKYNLSNIEKILNEEQVVDMLVQDIDDSYNMIGVIGSNIKAILPRNEASSIVLEDGLVDTKHIVNKKGKILHVCIKEIIKHDDNNFELVVSKKKLELKVRRWMYMHLQVGMKLKGIVVSTGDYAAFVDVGGGVTGILKTDDLTENYIKHTSDVLKVGQRIQVIVKKFDRDTGRIELSYKEQLGTFEDLIKKYKEGDIVEGTIRGTIKTGVFVELQPNLVGMAEHVSGVEYGQKVLVSIKRIIPEKKKIKLIIIG